MRKTTSRTLPPCLILLFLMILVSAPVLGRVSPAMGGVMRKAPYLIYPGNNTQMKVLWQLNSTATSTIDWGIDTLYSVGSAQTSEYGSDHQHSYAITNLSPSTKYCYRVSVGADKFVGSFRAAPNSDTSSTKLIVYGDSRTYPADHDQVANGILSAYAADSSFQSLLISVGDLTTDGDQEAGWDTELFATGYAHLQTMLATMPFQVAMGNHERAGVLFTKYLPYPFVGGRYWSFDYGPAHFVIVDQYTNYGPGSAQLVWIESDLAATAKLWKFIVLHEPGWSADGAGGHSNNASVQNYIQPLCKTYGVRVVFGGHNHYYARAVVNGVQHITTGGAGAPLDMPNPAYPNVVAAASSLHYCKVEIDSNVFHLTAMTPGGQVIDEFSLSADLMPPQVTLVKPDGGEVFYVNSPDTIRWLATDNYGVDSVHIYYSTDGGSTYPYSIAANEANDGVYVWTVPSTPSTTCRVKVVAFDAGLNQGNDTSDNNFTISRDLTPPEVTVIRPNGGEVFYAMTQDTIKWIASDNNRIQFVDLFYSTNGGSTYPYTIDDFEANDGIFVWTTPFKNSSTCKVKVIAYDRDGNQGSDTSDNNFTITPDWVPPQVTVVRPNGGEGFYIGSQDSIRWVATDNHRVDSVSIYYSVDGGGTFPYTIATGEPNDSLYVWLVPDTPSQSCVVKVEAYDPTPESAGEDVSDAVFRIETAVGVGPAPGANVFGLVQNYPNPFNPLTRMEFSLSVRSHVSLKVYDVSGKPVRTLVDGTLGAGRHSALWNGEDEIGRPVASGVYVTRLEVEGRTAVCKSVLLR